MASENHLAGSHAPMPSDHEGPRQARRIEWLVAPVVVAFPGGLILALIESAILRRMFLSIVSLGIWLEFFSFSLVTHVAFGMAVCAIGSLACALLVSVAASLRRWVQPGPFVLAAWLAAQAIAIGLWIGMWHGLREEHIPIGATGLAVAGLVWLILLVPVGLICRKLHRTFLARPVATLGRLASWLTATLLIGAVLVLQHRGSYVRPAEGFWPPSSPSIQTRKGPPDIVLVVFDTLRADRLGCYGYGRPTSPHVDAFAADAVVYERAISPGVWTVPAHASMFTGLYPSQHGARWEEEGKDPWLDDRFVTLADALGAAGYQTMALSNNDYVSPATNLTQGFQQFFTPRGFWSSFLHFLFPFYEAFVRKTGGVESLLGPWFDQDRGGRLTARFAAKWLERRDQSRPFFLFVNYMETHLPFEPLRAYRRAFVRPGDFVYSYRIDQSESGVWDYMYFDKSVTTDDDVRIMSDLYDARVREVDDCFSELMDAIAARVDLDNTVIILTADHGENLGERGLLDHQYVVYNTLVHVPLILRWPRLLSPQRVDRLVQTCDIYPTLLAWASDATGHVENGLAEGLATPAKPTSRPRNRVAFAEYLHWPAANLAKAKRFNPRFDPSRWKITRRAIVDENWKLIVGSDGHIELYDMANDPNEIRNVIGADPSRASRMLQTLQTWLGSFEHYDRGRAPGPRGPGFDLEQRARLRNLGYVQ